MITRTRPDLESTAMGTSQDIFHTADKLARNALAELADVVAVEVSELMLHGEANTPGPFCTSAPLRRAAFHSAPGAELRPAYAVGEVVRIPAATPYRQSLTDLRPRLIRDLKRDGRWLTRESALAQAVRAAQAHSLIVIPLVARGVVLGLAGLYRRADSAPFDAGDLGKASKFTDRAARCLDIVHTRMQGRAHARLLQRALLPEALPSLSALDAAQGHIPTDGTGGEWFDIIPLPSARAALVVGAAQGQGTATAVGMSQLRAMIIALAIQDLEPDMEARRTRLHHHLGRQRTGHQRHPLLHRADTTAPHQRRSHTHLRSLRHQQRHSPPAEGRPERRRRTRPVHRHRTHPAPRHTPHRSRQDRLDRTAPLGINPPPESRHPLSLDPPMSFEAVL